jgi:hypothetical protein
LNILLPIPLDPLPPTPLFNIFPTFPTLNSLVVKPPTIRDMHYIDAPMAVELVEMMLQG